ncbi:Neprosin activation peptide [Arabidopsis thaliana x Arabidopsis arenosa]|uniref:Neprosin activation peptide n=1 Tax=Arabidopsis thaliana x Arabidopsis arenosa TaxID=1240361 RepID=A0A8T2E4Z9_9BRAS|nr:Neprosin activation peptide [Arabidopsis thaliana x Arabidopsis arenosa]
MDSSNKNLVLRILLTISLVLVSEAAHESRGIPSEEEKKEMERQLKAINKPAIKSFKTEQVEIFDCIDIHKQLAFDHHLLRNHSVKLKPTSVPKWPITYDNKGQKVGPMQLQLKGISCPHGTVIVKRTTIQDLINSQHLKSIGFNIPRHVLSQGSNIDLSGHHFATADYDYDNVAGVTGNINLWDPQVSHDQVSLATMAIAGGPKIEQLASISVGWMVNPLLYQDHIHLYTYWTADGYNKTGCYDIRCPGFVQVSKRIPLGVLLQPISVYNGTQKEMDLSLHQDRVTGDWWLIFGGVNVGYWPQSLFIASGLVKGADLASWGGQVYSPKTEKSPIMGSGHFPKEGFGKAAFVNNIHIMNGKGEALIPQIYTIETHESSPNCYKAKFVHDEDEPWIRAVYFGGPGGC